MSKLALQFMVTLGAVLIGLVAYETWRSSRATGDFGAGALQERNKVLQGDFERAAGAAKTSVTEYYMSRGAWPAKNEEAGLPAPASYRGQSLKTLVVAGATITLTFDARSGMDGGQVVLTGTPTPDLAMGINWACTSPNLVDITAALPGCTYRKP